MLLPGRRTRVGAEVEAWASRAGVTSKGVDLLSDYNAAVERGNADARRLLALAAEAGAGRLALIGLLNRQGTSDQERVLALDALDGPLTSEEVAELARVNVNQRPAVLPSAVRLLFSTTSSEAAFALRRVFGGGESSTLSEAKRCAREILRRLDGPPARGWLNLESRDVLFVALASERTDQAELRQLSAEARAMLQTAASHMDASLIESGRRPNGLSTYESILRRELHVLTAIASLDGDEVLWTRANDTLFTSLDPAYYEQLAPAFAPAVADGYFERATTEANVRKRADRAVSALRTSQFLSDSASSMVRERVGGLLNSPDEEVRFAAAVALATTDDDLTMRERRALEQAYGSLGADMQQRLAPHMGVVADEIGETQDLKDLIRWALAAPDHEVGDRLARLLLRWSGTSQDDGHDLARAVGDLIRKLPAESRDATELSSLNAALAWLRKRQGGASAVRALRSWSRFGVLAATHLGVVTEALSPLVTRRLLKNLVLDPDGDVDVDLLSALIMGKAETPEAIDALRETLGDVASSHVEAIAGLFPQLAEQAQRMIIAAGLQAHRNAMADIARLQTTLTEKSTQALVSRRAEVLAAIEDAAGESAGNPGLEQQLEMIRRAVAGVSVDEGDGTSETVRAWRNDASKRFPSLIRTVDDGRQPLEVVATSVDDGRGLSPLMMELDQRANARGTVPARDRADYRADLSECVRAFAKSGALQAEHEAGPPTKRRSPELMQMLDSAWIAGIGPAIGPEIVRELAAPEQPSTERERLRALQGLVGRADTESIHAVASSADIDDVGRAWKRVLALCRDSSGRRDKLKAQVDTQEQTAMERIASHLAIPFQAIESYFFGYFRLRQILAEAGWGRVAPHLGADLSREEIRQNLYRYEIRGEGSADRFLVRSLGIAAGGAPVQRAIVEAMPPRGAGIDVEEDGS